MTRVLTCCRCDPLMAKDGTKVTSLEFLSSHKGLEEISAIFWQASSSFLNTAIKGHIGYKRLLQ